MGERREVSRGQLNQVVDVFGAAAAAALIVQAERRDQPCASDLATSSRLLHITLGQTLAETDIHKDRPFSGATWSCQVTIMRTVINIIPRERV